MNMKMIAIAAAAAALLGMGTANAQLTLYSAGSGIKASTYQTTDSGASWSSYSQGALQFNVDGGSTFYAYCIDPRTSSSYGVGVLGAYSQTTLETFLNGTATSLYAQQMARTAYPPGYNDTTLTDSGAIGTVNVASPTLATANAAVQATVLANLKELFTHAYDDSLRNTTNAAAFGMAVWEVIMQDGTKNDLGGNTAAGGRVRSTGGDTTANSDPIETRLNAYLTALNAASEATGWQAVKFDSDGNGSLDSDLGASKSYTYTVYYDNTSPQSQSFLKVTTGTNSTVPVPGTLALVGLGLLGAARVRRARRVA